MQYSRGVMVVWFISTGVCHAKLVVDIVETQRWKTCQKVPRSAPWKISFSPNSDSYCCINEKTIFLNWQPWNRLYSMMSRCSICTSCLKSLNSWAQNLSLLNWSIIIEGPSNLAWVFRTRRSSILHTVSYDSDIFSCFCFLYDVDQRI